MKKFELTSESKINVFGRKLFRIKALIDLGEKGKRVFIVPKGKDEKTRYIFEETEFGYSFKEVRL